jgi:hypothetical protein
VGRRSPKTLRNKVVVFVQCMVIGVDDVRPNIIYNAYSKIVILP